MITIPLADVVSYLTRKGVDLACLEGAPYIYGDPELPRRDWLSSGLLHILLDPVLAPSNAELYLGRDAVCPAAMGWATVVLATAVGRDPADQYAIHFDGTEVDLYELGDENPCFWGAWRFKGERTQRRQSLIKPAPSTPAARLRAVLEYEMGRDQ